MNLFSEVFFYGTGGGSPFDGGGRGGRGGGGGMPPGFAFSMDRGRMGPEGATFVFMPPGARGVYDGSGRKTHDDDSDDDEGGCDYEDVSVFGFERGGDGFGHDAVGKEVWRVLVGCAKNVRNTKNNRRTTSNRSMKNHRRSDAHVRKRVARVNHCAVME